ncbi:MAG: hypothetical protein GY861_18220 [bacterium]|nr:hypothetical protein [bacterium]
MKKEKILGKLFGLEFVVKFNKGEEDVVKNAEDWFQELEARERRVRNKEIELELNK